MCFGQGSRYFKIGQIKIHSVNYKIQVEKNTLMAFGIRDVDY